jgi:hypothetical protein
MTTHFKPKGSRITFCGLLFMGDPMYHRQRQAGMAVDRLEEVDCKNCIKRYKAWQKHGEGYFHQQRGE